MCDCKRTKLNGIRGFLLASNRNGGSIFLPVAGHYSGPFLGSAGSNDSDAYYWSGTLGGFYSDAASCIDFYYGSDNWNYSGVRDRYLGQSVRPVSTTNTTPTFKPFKLSSSSLCVTVGNQGTLNVIYGNGNYTALSSNSAVATVINNYNTIVVSGISAGTATIIVTDTWSNQSSNILVTVVESNNPSYISCPDDHHPHLIDLGLPSGTKWACCNVGATTPEGYGGYYAWGETEVKDIYSPVSYLYSTGEDTDGDGWYEKNESYQNIGYDIAGTGYDVAHVKWGGSWVMPSSNQIKELVDDCSLKWEMQNGVNGYRFTGSNGGSIFLPAAGDRWGDELDNAGSYGFYWSSTQIPSYSSLAYSLYFNSGDADWSNNSRRFRGHTVRPVSR